MVLAPNIAESSITIPALNIVINFCVRHTVRYDCKVEISRLEKAWVSKPSCQQRSGRVGRKMPGTAIHLVAKAVYSDLPSYEPPEMQQASADKLFSMAQELSHQLAITPHELLAITPHPPSPELLDAALFIPAGGSSDGNSSGHSS